MYYILKKFNGEEYSKIAKTLKGAKSYFYKLSNKNVYKLNVLNENFNCIKSICGYYNIVEHFKKMGV